MKTFLKAICAILFVSLITSCVGDAFKAKGDSTVFYIVKASTKNQTSLEENAKAWNINMLPVSIPAYMSRPQIVSMSGDRIEINEFKRWGEPPASSIERALAKNLETLVLGVSIFRYPSVSMDKNPVTLRVVISECIGAIGGKLNFSASWQIASENDWTSAGKFETSIDAGNNSDSYVAAISQACEALSIKIAEDAKSAQLNFEKTKEKQEK